MGRGSRRWAQWLLNHPPIGPLLRDWRADRSLPLRAKWLATLSMTASCRWAAYALQPRIAWIPALACLLVAPRHSAPRARRLPPASRLALAQASLPPPCPTIADGPPLTGRC